jgi:hypothetical protein
MRLIFLFSLVFGVSFASVCNQDEPILLDISNKGKTLIEFNEETIFFMDGTKPDGLIVEEVDSNSHNKFLLSFKKGREFEIIKQDGKEVKNFKRFVYSSSPADIYFFTADKKNKCVFIIKPVDNIDNKKKKMVYKYTYSKVDSNNEDIAKLEQKDNDNERDLLLSLNKEVFMKDTNNKGSLLSLYKTIEINKVVKENDKSKISLVSRKIGANFVQDMYILTAKKDITLDDEMLLSFSSLPPQDKRVRLVSVEKRQKLKTNQTAFIAIMREK